MDESHHAYSVLQQPWWWDATALRGWDEVEIRVDGECRARWPFVKARYGPGLTVLTAPPLTNRAGPWLRSSEGKLATRYGRAGALLEDLVEKLPPFHFFAQNMHSDLDYWLPLHWRKFQLEARISYMIDDCSDQERLQAGLSEATRRQIRKASQQLSVETIGAASLIDIIRKTFARQHKGMRVSPAVLESVMAAVTSRHAGHALGALDTAGQLHAAGLFVWDRTRMFYLLGGGDATLRSSGAGSLVIWQALREAGERGLAFDFEGSMLAPIERFFRGFGARQATYLNVTKGSMAVRLAQTAYQALTRRRGR